MSRCSYLGHVVGEELVWPEHSKVDSVKQFQIPATKSDVRTFLGLTGYYRKFIQEYAEIAAPLIDLTKNAQNHVQWTEQCDGAFNRLKDCMLRADIEISRLLPTVCTANRCLQTGHWSCVEPSWWRR